MRNAKQVKKDTPWKFTIIEKAFILMWESSLFNMLQEFLDSRLHGNDDFCKSLNCFEFYVLVIWYCLRRMTYDLRLMT